MEITNDRRLDAEQAVLGSLLIDESTVGRILSTVDPRDFLSENNRLIYQAARDLFRAGEPVDPVTIRGRIGQDFTDYLLQLIQITVTSANWQVYAKMMHEEATLTRIRDAAQQLSAAVNLDEARPLVASMTQYLSESQTVETWSMTDILTHFREAQSSTEAVKYITYGIKELDEGTYTEPGDVVIIGGYPSDGKTALSLMWAYHMAKDHRVGYISMETSKPKIGDRMVTQAMQISFDTIKRRTMGEGDWANLATKSSDFTGRDLHVVSVSGWTVTDISAYCQAMGFDIVILDYVQLVQPDPGRRYGTDAAAMAAVSRDLHRFAQSTGTLVIELAQLSRPPKQVGWREPDMHDLKETGQFEQDADTIFLLYQPKEGTKTKDGRTLDPDTSRLIKIAKNKEGRRGKWPLHFDGQHQTFSVMVDDQGRVVMLQLVNKGKKAKAKRGAQIPGQTDLSEIDESEDMPF